MITMGRESAEGRKEKCHERNYKDHRELCTDRKRKELLCGKGPFRKKYIKKKTAVGLRKES